MRRASAAFPVAGGAFQAWPKPHQGYVIPSTLLQLYRHYFVKFSSTPNAACVKFSVEGIKFLSSGGGSSRQGSISSGVTMTFDRTNAHQSPLADMLLTSLPMVAEVTIADAFITVRKTDEEDEEDMELAKQSFLNKSDEADAEAPFTASQQSENHDSSGSAADPKAHYHPPPESSVGEQQPPSNDPDDIHQRIRNLGKTDEDGITELDEETLRKLVRNATWDELRMTVCALITDHLYTGSPHINLDAPHPHQDTLPQEGDSEVVLAIKELIAGSLRPLVQQDGGDLRLERFDAEVGILSIEMLGACKSCKSSKTTLKDMIERTLQHWIPEVKEVVEYKPGKIRGGGPGAAAAGGGIAMADNASAANVAQSCAVSPPRARSA